MENWDRQLRRHSPTKQPVNDQKCGRRGEHQSGDVPIEYFVTCCLWINKETLEREGACCFNHKANGLDRFGGGVGVVMVSHDLVHLLHIEVVFTTMKKPKPPLVRSAASRKTGDVKVGSIGGNPQGDR